MTRVTVDTNVLFYAVQDSIGSKQHVALDVLSSVRGGSGGIGLQVIGEFFHVASRKLKISRVEIARQARELIALNRTFAATAATTDRAIGLAASGVLSFWDANLVSAAEAAGCTHLLTEDMHDGLRLGNLVIVNPFDGDALSERARDILSL